MNRKILLPIVLLFATLFLCTHAAAATVDLGALFDTDQDGYAHFGDEIFYDAGDPDWFQDPDPENLGEPRMRVEFDLTQEWLDSPAVVISIDHFESSYEFNVITLNGISYQLANSDGGPITQKFDVDPGTLLLTQNELVFDFAMDGSNIDDFEVSNFYMATAQSHTVPIPGTLFLLGSGLASLTAFRRKS